MNSAHDLGDESSDQLERADDSYTPLGSLLVDGETFLVRRRNGDGSHHYDWVSGPHDGYGFSVSGGPDLSEREWHETAIRGFLRSVDPETGHV